MEKKQIPKLKPLPTSGARREEQAHFVWIALSGWVLFNKGKTITYGELAELLGYNAQAGRTLRSALGAVSLYCLYNELPPLSCIVVRRDTNRTGWADLIPNGSTLENEQRKVWDTKWHLYRTPSVGIFRKVREELDWADTVDAPEHFSNTY